MTTTTNSPTVRFTPLPGLYFLFLIAMTIAYLLLLQLVKRPLMRQYAQ